MRSEYKELDIEIIEFGTEDDIITSSNCQDNFEPMPIHGQT